MPTPMQRHPLRREILRHAPDQHRSSTAWAPTFVHQLMEETDARPADIVRACLIGATCSAWLTPGRGIDALRQPR